MPAGALERAVELLGRLGEGPGELTVAELADATGMPASTAYRLLAELERHGLVRRGPDRRVALGTRVVALGRSAEEGLRAGLVDPARPVLEELCRAAGETAILTAPCGLDGIVLQVVETEQHSVRLSYARYRRAPMHRGASGKVLAAFLEEDERRRLLEAVGEPGLERRLEEIRAAGYAFTCGELDPEAAAVAAPVCDRRGRLAAGVSVAGPAERIVPALERVRELVIAAARRIERVPLAGNGRPG